MNVASLLSDGPPPSARPSSSPSLPARAPSPFPAAPPSQQNHRAPRESSASDYAYPQPSSSSQRHQQQHQRRPSSPGPMSMMPPPPQRTSKSPTISTLTGTGGPQPPSHPAAAGNNATPGPGYSIPGPSSAATSAEPPYSSSASYSDQRHAPSHFIAQSHLLNNGTNSVSSNTTNIAGGSHTTAPGAAPAGHSHSQSSSSQAAPNSNSRARSDSRYVLLYLILSFPSPRREALCPPAFLPDMMVQ